MIRSKYQRGITGRIFGGTTQRPKPVTCTNSGRRWCPEGDLNSRGRARIQTHPDPSPCSYTDAARHHRAPRQHPDTSADIGGSITRSITAWTGRAVQPVGLLMIAATLVAAGHPVSNGLDRQESMHGAMRAEAAQLVRDQVAQLSHGHHCTTSPRLAPTVLVVNAARDRAGRIQHDTAVVREVSFDRALEDAEQGRVWILRFCS